jgi:hypothetical protein
LRGRSWARSSTPSTNNRTSAIGYRVMFGIVTGFFLIALLTLQPVREIKID